MINGAIIDEMNFILANCANLVVIIEILTNVIIEEARFHIDIGKYPLYLSFKAKPAQLCSVFTCWLSRNSQPDLRIGEQIENIGFAKSAQQLPVLSLVYTL